MPNSINDSARKPAGRVGGIAQPTNPEPVLWVLGDTAGDFEPIGTPGKGKTTAARATS